MIVAFLPPLLALPLIWRSLPSLPLIAAWAAASALWLITGTSLLLYVASWFIWAALFSYIGSMRDDGDDEDFWDFEPVLPDEPRNFCKKSKGDYNRTI